MRQKHRGKPIDFRVTMAAAGDHVLCARGATTRISKKLKVFTVMSRYHDAIALGKKTAEGRPARKGVQKVLPLRAAAKELTSDLRAPLN